MKYKYKVLKTNNPYLKVELLKKYPETCFRLTDFHDEEYHKLLNGEYTLCLQKDYEFAQYWDLTVTGDPDVPHKFVSVSSFIKSLKKKEKALKQ